MMELTINGQVYAFIFGMGFLREINRRVSAPVDGLKDIEKAIGFRYFISGIVDGELEALVEVLEAANKGQNPRVTRALLDAYIDDENTDVDALFDGVIDFLNKSNATKKVTTELVDLAKAQKAQIAHQMEKN